MFCIVLHNDDALLNHLNGGVREFMFVHFSFQIILSNFHLNFIKFPAIYFWCFRLSLKQKLNNKLYLFWCLIFSYSTSELFDASTQICKQHLKQRVDHSSKIKKSHLNLSDRQDLQSLKKYSAWSFFNTASLSLIKVLVPPLKY